MEEHGGVLCREKDGICESGYWHFSGVFSPAGPFRGIRSGWHVRRPLSLASLTAHDAHAHRASSSDSPGQVFPARDTDVHGGPGIVPAGDISDSRPACPPDNASGGPGIFRRNRSRSHPSECGSSLRPQQASRPSVEWVQADSDESVCGRWEDPRDGFFPQAGRHPFPTPKIPVRSEKSLPLSPEAEVGTPLHQFGCERCGRKG